MAMENKRIIQLNTERTTPAADDYVMVDSATAGTAKYLLPKITDAIDQEISDRTSADTTLQGSITAEATARTAADTAINGEITQLKEDFGYYPEDAYTDFVQGAWNLLRPTTNANRLRSNDAFELQAGDTIAMNFSTTGCDGVVAIISKEGTLISDSGWKHVPYTYTASENVYAIVNEKKTNNSAIVPSESTIIIMIKRSIENRFADIENDFENYDVTDKYMNWVVGTLNTSGLPANATYRLRTTNYIPFSAFHKMTWDSGYRTMVAFYGQDYSYLGGTAEINTGIITREYLEELQSCIYYIKILFANPSVSTVTVDALTDAHFTLYTINSQNNSYDDFIENKLPYTWDVPYRNILQMQGDGFTFAIQTDTHFNKEIPPYYNTIKNLSRRIGFDFIANLGDIIRGYEYDTVTDSYEEFKKAIKGLVDGAECATFALMGNHDNGAMYATATGLIADAFLPGELFSLFERPTTTEDSAVVWGSREGLYFYRDFDRVRVVVLNTSDLPYQEVSTSDINVNVMMISTAQVNWFTQTALDTDKPVLVLSHAPLDGSITVTNGTLIVSAMESFVSGGGTIIANIAGHTHSIGATKTNGINYIICDNGGDLCEVFAVDLDARTISTQQIGKDFTGNRSFTF